jgi:hypothetical protein
MTGLAVLCGAALLVIVYRDLVVPEARDTEVWLGFEVHGPIARLTAPIHWAIFALGAWAFWTGRASAVGWGRPTCSMRPCRTSSGAR